MSRKLRLLAIPAAVLSLTFMAGCGKPEGNGRKIKFYQSPMHPWITSKEPGNCTICGMELVPIYDGEEGFATKAGTISLGSESLHTLNVEAVKAKRGELRKVLRFSGILDEDENTRRVVAAFYDGRIEEIYVHHVGQSVEKNKPLVSIYSPELLYVAREFQNAVRGGQKAIAENSAKRLIQYGLTSEQVNGLANRKDNFYTLELLAPTKGVVIVRNVSHGQYIKTGEPLFEIADPSKLWLHAEVYERDLQDIRIGQKAIVRTPTVPGTEFEGTVTFIDPRFDPQTRSTKIRIEINNPLSEEKGTTKWVLPYQAYAEAEIDAELGEALLLPRSAVLQDGRRAVVYVEKADGQFEQRAVRTGRVGDSQIEILEGVKEGERVVMQGNLMIDAEAQLRSGAEMPEPLEAKSEAPAGIASFFKQLALLSEALASDNPQQASDAAKSLPQLVKMIPKTENANVNEMLSTLQDLPPIIGDSDLKAQRKAFLEWSVIGSDLAMALARSGINPGVHVYECPMTSGSFPGAPNAARWVQASQETRNPYFGAEMLNCGSEVRP